MVERGNRLDGVPSAGQPLDSFVWSQSGEQLLGGQPEKRVPPIGRNFGERRENESAQVQPRMRQNERSCVDNLTAIIEEVQIEHTRRIWLAAHAPKSSLQRVQPRKQIPRAEMGCQGGDRINKPWLL